MLAIHISPKKEVFWHFCHRKKLSQKGNFAIKNFPKKEIWPSQTFSKRKYYYQNISFLGNVLTLAIKLLPKRNFPDACYSNLSQKGNFLTFLPSEPLPKRKFFRISAIKTFPKKEMPLQLEFPTLSHSLSHALMARGSPRTSQWWEFPTVVADPRAWVTPPSIHHFSGSETMGCHPKAMG